jgi:acetyl-CoA acetyltransferase
MHGGAIAIVGAAETDEVGVLPNMSVLELHAQASLRAVGDAGLTVTDIDGIATANPIATEVAQHLGITPRWIDGTSMGGCSFLAHVRHAAAAIAAGAADVVLVSHGESGRSGNGSTSGPTSPQSLNAQFERPYGAIAPYQLFTLPALRFLHERNMTERDLAEVVVAQRDWSTDNPRAMRRKPVTVDDVLNGPVIAYPFRKEMCCVVTDGGGALIVTSAERAIDLPAADRAVYLLGSGESSGPTLVSQMDELTSFGGFRRSSTEAFATSGLTHDDVDHLMCYDAFAHLPLYMLEDLGFVGRGESGALIAEGHTRPGGKLPMNTNGGGLAYTHTGRYGMFAILEAVRQLRGEAVVQVDGVQTSFVQGVGVFFAASASLVLSNWRP